MFPLSGWHGGSRALIRILTARSLVFLLHSHYRDLGESFGKSRRPELRGHAPHDILRHAAVATLVALDANFQRNGEKYGVDLVAVVFSKFDPMLTLLRGKVGRVDIVHRTLGDQARLEHRAQVREY